MIGIKLSFTPNRLLSSNVPLQHKIWTVNWKSWLVCWLHMLVTWKLPFLVLCVCVHEWGVSYQGGHQTGATPLLPSIWCHM